ncbi:hypothetical protein AAG906_000437 [Vitis piasezkii]
MENLRELHLNGTAIKELPSSIKHLNRLEVLILDRCQNVVTLPRSTCNLCFLEVLNLMQGVILSDICCLYSLEVLDLSFCNIDEGRIPSEIFHLSSLQELHLTGNQLGQIPALPSSLHVLDVHECTRLETSSGLLWSSLFNCFKSAIQDFECRIYAAHKSFAQVSLIISGSSGISKWISHHKKGAENWYKNNDLLGFVLYCVYDPLDNDYEERLENYGSYFKYGLTLCGHEISLVDELQFYHWWGCHDVAIKKYHSNKWRQLTASFCGCFEVKAMKVDECGIHLIYAHDHEQNHELDSLCLRECKNFERLPSSICELKSLTYLNLTYCTKLVSLPESICNLSSLKFLNVSFCTKLEKFPENLMGLQCLKRLYASGTAIEELPSSFEHLQGLQCLKLARWDSLVSLPESICNLSSLRTLDVSFCTKLEKFPENLRSLQCLKHLYASGLNLSMDCFRSIPAGIIQLSKLRILELSHCQGLLQVPELPPSLRYVDVHSCTCLETLSSLSSQLGLSLFKCFKSMIEEFECGSYWKKAIRVVISGNNGIPEWISQQKKGSQITIELPMDWYRKDDFLGFALYSVFIPMACDGLNCELNICVELKQCGYYLIYTRDVSNRNIPEDTSTDAQRSCDNTEATKRDHQTMIEYTDEQRSCDTRSAAERY